MGQPSRSIPLGFRSCALIVQKIVFHFLANFSFTSLKTRNRPAFAVTVPETLASQGFSSLRQSINIKH
jgi:hypothetical protein